jgi:hypothetical protein
MQTATAQDIGPRWPCWGAVSRIWVNDPAPAITASTVTGSASATARLKMYRDQLCEILGRPWRNQPQPS